MQTAMGEDLNDLRLGLSGLRLHAQPFPKQAGEAAGAGAARPVFASREFPEAGQEAGQGPPREKDAAVLFQDAAQVGDPLLRRLPARGRDPLLPAVAAGDAAGSDRARGTARMPGQADGRSQIHQGLVEIAGAVLRHKLTGDPPEPGLNGGLPGVLPDPEIAAEDPEDISVKDRRGAVEGDAGDGAGGGPADPRQPGEILRTVGDPAPALAHDLDRPGMQVLRARIVAQPGPGIQDGGQRGAGEGLEAREAAEEPLIVGNDGLHLRLLKHRLGHPDVVGIPALSPGKMPAGVSPVPGQKPILQRAHGRSPTFRSEPVRDGPRA